MALISCFLKVFLRQVTTYGRFKANKRRPQSFAKYFWNFISDRLSKVSIALAERGYNVTSLSADIDKVPTPNLHYLHLEAVYDRLYNTELEIDYFSIGNKSPWAMIKLTLDFSHLICEGAVHSTGWKQLQDYPDDFKVHTFSLFV